MKKAVCLVSGGLDSATVLYYAKNEGWDVYALNLLYGQRHKRERDSARQLCANLSVPLKEMELDFPWKGSSLVDQSEDLPQSRNFDEMKEGIPSTYVPARNTIFLSLALGMAEVLKAHAVFIGANVLDYSGYPDCRPEYLKAVEEVFRLGTKLGQEGHEIKIIAPLLMNTKAEIIKLGFSLKVPFGQTWSCYAGREKSCGLCDSCLLRKQGFMQAGLEDSIEYESSNGKQ